VAILIAFLLLLVLLVLLIGQSAFLGILTWLVISVAALSAALLIFGAVFVAVADFIRWLPRSPRFFSSFLRGWFKLVAAPVIGTRQYWHEIREARRSGTRVGPLSVAGNLAWAFLIYCCISIFAIGLPAIIAFVALIEPFFSRHGFLR
jgi:hypothetical protein